jgi:DNA-binding CsgD family transcriptional regulator
MLIPYDSASFYLAGEGNDRLLRDPVTVNITMEKLKEYDEYEDIDYTRWIFMSGKNMAYRETDLFSGPERESSRFYSEFYVQHGIHYSLQLSLAFHERFLGIVSLYRPKGQEDFTEKDVFILEQVKEHMAFRLYRDAVGSSPILETVAVAGEGTAENTSGRFDLTNREMEILSLILKGLSNQDVAESLFISEHTVKKHVLNIYRKLHVRNRMQLLRFQVTPAAIRQRT